MTSATFEDWQQHRITFWLILFFTTFCMLVAVPAVADDVSVKGIDKEEQLRINMSSAIKLETSHGSPFAAVRLNPPADAGLGMIPGRVDHFQIMQTGQPVFTIEPNINGEPERIGMLIDEDGELRFLMMQGEQNFIEYVRTLEQLRVQNEYYQEWLGQQKSKENK